MQTPLSKSLPADLARETYFGAETVAHFGDAASELAALRNSGGVHDLGWLSFIKLTGEDRARWLNGMVTNNTRDLKEDEGNYSFVLSTQGRIQGDLIAYQCGDHYLLITDEAQRESLAALLDKYIIMDDVLLEDISNTMTVLGVTGPSAQAICTAAGLPQAKLNLLQRTQWNSIDLTITLASETPTPSIHLMFAPEHVATVWQALTSAGAIPAGSQALEMLRVINGVPVYGRDIREKELPQETAQDRALHFAKGCYVGQEIVERIRSRGIVHRGLAGFVLDRSISLPPAGENLKVVHEGKDMGYVTSLARIPTPAGERYLALGYLRREAATPGTSVTIGEAQATVSALPFKL